jgi:hypothetical protein
VGAGHFNFFTTVERVELCNPNYSLAQIRASPSMGWIPTTQIDVERWKSKFKKSERKWVNKN